VRHAQAEPRQQVRRERVADRRGLPAGVTRLLRLLEIVGQRARVDTQDPDLARRLLASVARRRLELGLEVLRQAEADRLLRIAAGGEVPTGGIERERKCRIDRGSRRVGVADLRRDRMANPGDGPESREEREESRAEAGAELQPFALAEKLPVRVLITDHERPLRRLVHDRDGRLQLPGSREKRGQVDPGLPVNGGAERLVEQHPAGPARDRRVRDVDFLPRIADVVRHIETVGPVPGADAERSLKAHRRGPVVEERGVQPAPGQDHGSLLLMKRLLLGERKPGRPGDGWRDVDRGRREAHRRYGLRYETAPDLLMPVTAYAEGPPGELFGEVHLRPEAGGREERVHRILLNDSGAARVVDARVEACPRGKPLLVLPPEPDGGAGKVELAVALD